MEVKIKDNKMFSTFVIKIVSLQNSKNKIDLYSKQYFSINFTIIACLFHVIQVQISTFSSTFCLQIIPDQIIIGIWALFKSLMGFIMGFI